VFFGCGSAAPLSAVNIFPQKNLSLPENIFRKFAEASRNLFSEFFPVVFLSLFHKKQNAFPNPYFGEPWHAAHPWYSSCSLNEKRGHG
jgi:hypothetical protein